MKKLLALLLALAMPLTLAACGGKDDAAPDPVPQAVTDAPAPVTDAPADDTAAQAAAVPGAVQIALPEGDVITDAKLQDGVFYIGAYGSTDPEDYTGGMDRIYTAGTDGSAPALLYTRESSDIDDFSPSQDGSVWLSTYHFDLDAQTSEQNLIHVGADGSVLAELATADVAGDVIPQLFPAADGGVLLLSYQTVYTLDSAGSVIASADIEGSMREPLLLPDGQIVYHQEAYGLDGVSAAAFVKLDPATGAVTPLPDRSELGLSYASPLCADGNTLWFTRTGSSVYTLDMATGAETEMYTLMNAGINVYDMRTCFVRDGVLWSAESPASMNPTMPAAGSNVLTLYPARAGEDDRPVLTLATMRSDNGLTQMVTRFNRLSADYRIQVRDYTADDPWIDHALEKLNYDIIGGDIPDMFLLDSMPRHTLVKQGLLADLSPYLAADPDITADDYLMNVIDASREDGQLLGLFGAFQIGSLAALPGQSVTVENNTLENLFSLQTQDMDTAVLQCTDGEQDTLAALLLAQSPEDIVDLANASCSFDGVKFRALAEMLAAMPATEYNYDLGASGAEVPYRLFQAYLMQYGDIEFDNLNGWAYTGGEEPPIDQRGSTLVGWPTSQGGMYDVMTIYNFAISSRSAYPDGCWAFIRQILTEDAFQQRMLENGEGFCLKRSVLDAWADMCVQYEAATRADVDTVNAIFQSDRLRVDHGGLMDQVFSIVTEELEPYFDGTIDLDTAVAALQSRVSLYLSENS